MQPYAIAITAFVLVGLSLSAVRMHSTGAANVSPVSEVHGHVNLNRAMADIAGQTREFLLNQPDLMNEIRELERESRLANERVIWHTQLTHTSADEALKALYAERVASLLRDVEVSSIHVKGGALGVVVATAMASLEHHADAVDVDSWTIEDTKIEPGEMAWVQQLRPRSLRLLNCDASRKVWGELGGLHSLHTLVVEARSSAGKSGIGESESVGLSQAIDRLRLRELSLSLDVLYSGLCASVCRSKALRELSLGFAAGGHGLSALGNLSALERLDLFVPIEAAHAVCLSESLPALRGVRLWIRSPEHRALLNWVGGHSRIREVDLRISQSCEWGWLARCHGLESLAIEGAFNVTVPPSFTTSLGGLRRLWDITVKDCTGMDAEACKALASLSGLRRLDLAGTDIDNAGLESLGHSSTLEWVGLHATDSLEADFIGTWSSRYPRIRVGL